ncbi:Clp protease ClpP [Segatella copri]|uniref:ATP-dependent Clp protease proteolytic subunit n=1 Tax=Segatella copri TaxID=165179 RepID=A0AAW5UC24_9BACT|nr:ATP-dependent Clp protease proteolytic subunit [Segatella copri]MCW4137307.1 ATP-dependent Clp protease proteolytic subunit [Segatella copri]MCW4142959.1 ATP-dependent Clp protease proteolytic subunit [Segatella copri]MCW4167545.1 ATP-dependent Clp protease proteolytic subunit [Segatella copri]
MAKLRIYNDIDSQDKKFWYQWWGGDCVCFQDIDAFATSIPKDDDTIDMRIFCNGGSVVEGWAIYDRLRQSGKKISCTVEGKAASMATIIMLAAPKESRKAYENAAFLLHNPWVPGWGLGDQLNAKDLKNLGEEMQMWQDKMVDAYVERCECDREEIQALMDKDIFISTSEAMRLGLISSTVAPISASASKRNIENFINSKQQNPKAMEKKTEVKASLLDKILAKLGVKTLEEAEQAVAEPQAKAEPKAMELNTADGQTLTVEREEGDPQVGDKASPDGTFEMPDGKTIVVEDGVITDIQTADNTDNDNDNEGGEGGEGGSASSTDNDTVAKLKQQVAALKQQLNETKAQLAGAQKLAKSKEDMRILNAVKMAGGAEKVLAGYSSHYQPAQRQPSGKGAGDNVNAVEEGKNAIKERLAKLHKKGKK